MAANKVRAVRAAVYCGGGAEIIKNSKIHNNANVLSLGGDYLSEADALSMVKLWLETEFLNEERHIRRLEKIKKFEEENFE